MCDSTYSLIFRLVVAPSFLLHTWVQSLGEADDSDGSNGHKLRIHTRVDKLELQRDRSVRR